MDSSFTGWADARATAFSPAWSADVVASLASEAGCPEAASVLAPAEPLTLASAPLSADSPFFGSASDCLAESAPSPEACFSAESPEAASSAPPSVACVALPSPDASSALVPSTSAPSSPATCAAGA